VDRIKRDHCVALVALRIQRDHSVVLVAPCIKRDVEGCSRREVPAIL
jgi:hypothetical protein